MGLVYKVISPSGKIYVGQTKRSLEARKQEHMLAAATGDNNKFHKAIRKYGELLIWEIVTECSESQLDIVETSTIKEYKSNICGYNLTSGGDGGYVRSTETKQMLSDLAKSRFKDPKNHPMYGHKMSEESKEKNRLSQLENYKDVALRNKVSIRTKAAMADPQIREKCKNKHIRKGKDSPNYKQRINIVCLCCGGLFEMLPHLKDQHFCSHACASTREFNSFYGKQHTFAAKELMSKNHVNVNGLLNPSAKKYVIESPAKEILTFYTKKEIKEYCDNVNKHQNVRTRRLSWRNLIRKGKSQNYILLNMEKCYGKEN